MATVEKCSASPIISPHYTRARTTVLSRSCKYRKKCNLVRQSTNLSWVGPGYFQNVTKEVTWPFIHLPQNCPNFILSQVKVTGKETKYLHEFDHFKFKALIKTSVGYYKNERF